jgi:hypothetical protein
MDALDLLVWSVIGLIVGGAFVVVIVARRAKPRFDPLAESRQRMEKESWRWTDNSSSGV